MQSPKVTNGVLAAKLDYLTELVQAHVESDERHFISLNSFIDGNGNLGAKTRIDRLEQLEDSRKWHVRSLWTAICAGFIGVIVKMIIG